MFSFLKHRFLKLTRSYVVVAGVGLLVLSSVLALVLTRGIMLLNSNQYVDDHLAWRTIYLISVVDIFIVLIWILFLLRFLHVRKTVDRYYRRHAEKRLAQREKLREAARKNEEDPDPDHE